MKSSACGFANSLRFANTPSCEPDDHVFLSGCDVFSLLAVVLACRACFADGALHKLLKRASFDTGMHFFTKSLNGTLASMGDLWQRVLQSLLSAMGFCCLL